MQLQSAESKAFFPIFAVVIIATTSATAGAVSNAFASFPDSLSHIHVA